MGVEASVSARGRKKSLVAVLVLLIVLIGYSEQALGQQEAEFHASDGDWPPCEQPGWFPSEFDLKDHTVFWYTDAYYIASIYMGDLGWENRFAYARSKDLCTWEDLGTILSDRPPDGWDSSRIWAPFVLEVEGTYYMYYTGVVSDVTQSIMLAVSDNPADPATWQRRGMIFQPSHEGMVWPGEGHWSDCRDPTVRFWGSLYYLYYTGQDKDGGIVGLATAESPQGPWRDWGSILTVPGAMLESSTVVYHNGWYYLLYHRSDGTGEEMRFGPSPSGPWSEPRLFRPGWAHEIWKTAEGAWMTSYLTSYQISIRPLTWDDAFSPPWPFIGEQVHHLWIPLLMQAEQGTHQN
ncbi:MAG: family 43 glycosylhydrolase [Anaerolineae bacterium]